MRFNTIATALSRNAATIVATENADGTVTVTRRGTRDDVLATFPSVESYESMAERALTTGAPPTPGPDWRHDAARQSFAAAARWVHRTGTLPVRVAPVRIDAARRLALMESAAAVIRRGQPVQEWAESQGIGRTTAYGILKQVRTARARLGM